MPQVDPAERRLGLVRQVRRSMTARIGVSIAVVGMILVGAYAFVIDRLVAAELRDQNEIQLLSKLSFLRDDLLQTRGGLADVQTLIDREELQQRLHIELQSTRGAALLRTPGYRDPPADFALEDFDATALPQGNDLPALRAVRAASSPVTRVWSRADVPTTRMVQGVIKGLPPETGLPAEVIASLGLEPTKAAEVRRAEMVRLVVALALTLLVGGGLGILLARHAVADARRLGRVAERIGANELHERLALHEFPVELEGSARALNVMLDRLEASFDRLSRFSAEVAHDLRTPIGNLLGEAQVALSKARSAEEYRAVLESAVEEYERISRMIGNMLFLARSDSDQNILNREPLPLGELLQRIVAYFELVAEDKGVRLRACVQADPAGRAVLLADDSLIVRALGNLVANALRFAPAGSEVVIEGAPDGRGGWVVAVSNAGPKIPPEHLERIFDRFYRISPSREDSASGSGLGLAIVRSVMDLHQGSAEVQSDETVTRFALHFPAA